MKKDAILAQFVGPDRKVATEYPRTVGRKTTIVSQ
jgi:hypothetical protein